MGGTNQISLWNLALGHLGVKSISLPTEVTPAAQALTRAWDVSRRETLGMFPVPCATVVEALALVSGYTPPTTQWSYAYQYPSKSLRVWVSYNEATLDKNIGEDYRTIFVPDLNTRVILSNTEEAIAEYSYDLLDVSQYDSALVTAMSFILAANVSMDLVSDPKVALNMMQAFQQKASEAFRLSSYEKRVGTSGKTTLLGSRGV